MYVNTNVLDLDLQEKQNLRYPTLDIRQSFKKFIGNVLLIVLSFDATS